MSIITPLPVTLQNGTLADANQVMADFNQIVGQVNANAAHSGANSDITSIEGLTTPLPVSEGGTGATNAADARTNLGITAALAALVQVPIGGTITWNAPGSIPSGFLEENGQALSRTTYATLFSIIGTAFGTGDGSTTFNIPDSRGEFDRGWDNGRGVDPGRVFGSTQADTVGPHGHPVTDTHKHNFTAMQPLFTNQLALGMGGGSNIDHLTQETTTESSGSIVVNNNTGTTETRPKNIARMKIIRVQ